MRSQPALPERFSTRKLLLLVSGICLLLSSFRFESPLFSGLFGWLQTVLVLLIPLILLQYPLFLLIRKYLPREGE